MIAQALEVIVFLFTCLVSLIAEQSTCSMYILVHGVQKYQSTPTRKVDNIEIIDNYSVILPNGGYLKVRMGPKSWPFYQGNSIDLDCLGLQHSIYHHFHRADVCLYGVYFYDYFIELANKHYPYRYPNATNHSLQVYQKIVLGFSHHPQYGHFMHDMLCPIMSMPAEILEGADIFVHFKENEARNIFSFLGFDPKRIHSLTGQWVHGIDVHATVSQFGINAMFQAWIDLHHYIYQKYNLYNIAPTQMTAINKPKGNWGCVGNFDALFERAKKLYPEYNWKLYPASTLFDIERTAKILAASKLYVSAAGSACFNCIYMHENTQILFFTRQLPDNPALAGVATLGIFAYAISTENLSNVSLSDFDPGLHEIMYVVKYGHWNNGIENRTSLLFDISFYKRGIDIYSETGKTNVLVHSKSFRTNTHRKIQPCRTFMEFF